MSLSEIISGLNKNDPQASRDIFDLYYGKLFPVSLRYAKNTDQARELFNYAFNLSVGKLQKTKTDASNHDSFIKNTFILACVDFIKDIRSEYYVASTVYASNKESKNYDLFEANDLIDFDSVDKSVIIKALQQLVPSQRLIFNLHVIENYSLDESAEILEASVHTVKANLEKARYNLQKNIEKCLKEVRYEQSL